MTLSLVLDEIARLFDDSRACELLQTDEKFVVVAKAQAMLATKFSDPKLSMICELIVTHALECERVCPRTLQRFILSLKNDERFSQKEVILSRRAMLADMEIFFEDLDVDLVAAAKFAITSVGFNGTIFIEKSKGADNVEVIDGFVFEQARGSNKQKLVNPLVVCVDGYVESVSEIHHFLEEVVANKRSVLFLSRGFSDDVLHTLKVNDVRGSLKVVPIVVKFDIEGLNTLVDVATACGSDVFSSLKGNTFSSLHVSDLVEIDECVVFGDRILIKNKRVSDATKSLASDLRRRRSEETDETKVKLLDARLRSLRSKQVIVRLRDDVFYVKRAHALDQAFRAFRLALKSGITVDTNELAASIYALEKHVKACLSQLEQVLI